MNNYYYSLPLPLSKQASRIIPPVIITNSQSLVRGCLSDRSFHQLRNSFNFSPNNHANMQLLMQQENKHYECQPIANHNSKCQLAQHPKSLQDYQIHTNGVKPERALAEENQMPNGGGLNIVAHKIGQKIKNKAQLLKSKSKSVLSNVQSIYKQSHIKAVQTTPQTEKIVLAKSSVNIDEIKDQITKLNERITKHEQRMDKLQQCCKVQQKTLSEVSSKAQFQQMNKILNLVEKSQNREDHRKSMSMIQDLRSTILNLHAQLTNMKCDYENDKRQAKQLYNKKLDDSIRVGMTEINKKIQQQVKVFDIKLKDIDARLKLWRKEQQQSMSSHITSSSKRFVGKMITLTYEQKILLIQQVNNDNMVTLGLTKATNKATSEKQNSGTSIMITSKVYYLDSDGYLLDKNRYYLLNKRNEQIKLSEREIDLLKKYQIIGENIKNIKN